MRLKYPATVFDPEVFTWSNATLSAESVGSQPSFASLGLGPNVIKALDKAGFSQPTDIQAQAIPLALAGGDLIAQAKTGSGKTAAFILPVIERLTSGKGVDCLVLVPTRELAQQVVDESSRFMENSRDRFVSVIGGESIFRQVELVNRGAKIVVATPGRLLDHLRSGRFKSFDPTTVVLDEADEILDMGFLEDVKAILGMLPSERQTLLFSATMPKPIRNLAARELKDPVEIKLIPKGELANKQIDQILHVVKAHERQNALVRVLDMQNPQKAIVFCRTKRDVDELNVFLSRIGYKSKALHGDISQNERNRIITDMRDGRCTILIATDVASRGLDIDGLSHVINFQLPEQCERFIHRVGRTGRGGQTGKAITLVTEQEWRSHAFFRNYPRKKFQLEALATKSATRELLHGRLVDDIKKVAVSPDTRESLQDMNEEQGFEFMCQLFTYIQSQKKVVGGEVIGICPDTALRQLKTVRPRSESNGRHRRPFSGSSRRGPGRPTGKPSKPAARRAPGPRAR